MNDSAIFSIFKAIVDVFFFFFFFKFQRCTVTDFASFFMPTKSEHINRISEIDNKFVYSDEATVACVFYPLNRLSDSVDYYFCNYFNVNNFFFFFPVYDPRNILLFTSE